MTDVFFLAIDIETTGLDPRRDTILEVAARLIRPGTPPTEVGRVSHCVYVPATRLELMSERVRAMHEASGLLDACRLSLDVYSLRDAEKGIVDLVDAHAPAGARVVAFGNSVHFDRSFIDVHMPRLAKKLHYHILDVTSVAYFFRLFGAEPPTPEKSRRHRADADLDETMDEAYAYAQALNLYRLAN